MVARVAHRAAVSVVPGPRSRAGALLAATSALLGASFATAFPRNWSQWRSERGSPTGAGASLAWGMTHFSYAPVWEVCGLGDFDTSIVAGDGVVFIGSADGSWNALDIATRDFRWTVQLDKVAHTVGPFGAFLSADGTRLFVGGSGLHVTALDAATGAVLWVAPVELQSSVVGDDVAGRLFASTMERNSSEFAVVALDAHTGALLWSFASLTGHNFGDGVSLSPDLTTLYAVDFSGAATALDAATGALVWRTENVSDAAISGQVAVSPDGTQLFVQTWAPAVLALSATTGAVQWTVALDSISFGSPTLFYTTASDGTPALSLAVSTTGGDVRALRASDGTELWSLRASRGSILDSLLATQMPPVSLELDRAADAARQRVLQSAGAASSTLTLPFPAILYSAAQDGTVVALHGDSGAILDSATLSHSALQGVPVLVWASLATTPVPSTTPPPVSLARDRALFSDGRLSVNNGGDGRDGRDGRDANLLRGAVPSTPLPSPQTLHASLAASGTLSDAPPSDSAPFLLLFSNEGCVRAFGDRYHTYPTLPSPAPTTLPTRPSPAPGSDDDDDDDGGDNNHNNNHRTGGQDSGSDGADSAAMGRTLLGVGVGLLATTVLLWAGFALYTSRFRLATHPRWGPLVRRVFAVGPRSANALEHVDGAADGELDGVLHDVDDAEVSKGFARALAPGRASAVSAVAASSSSSSLPSSSSPSSSVSKEIELRAGQTARPVMAAAAAATTATTATTAGAHVSPSSSEEEDETAGMLARRAPTRGGGVGLKGSV